MNEFRKLLLRSPGQLARIKLALANLELDISLIVAALARAAARRRLER